MNTVRRPVIGVTYPASPEAATKLLETPVGPGGPATPAGQSRTHRVTPIAKACWQNSRLVPK